MPFKSQAQRAWMHIHHPKMAKRWEKHTPSGKKLPRKVKEDAEPNLRAVFEVKLEDDPELDPDEREELHAQLGDYELEPGDDEPGEDEPTPADIDQRRSAMMDALLAPEEPEVPAEIPPVKTPAEPTSVEPAQKISTRPKHYSRRMKALATRDPKLYSSEFLSGRADIGEYADEIDKLHGAGYTFGRIAQVINRRHGLKSSPGGEEKAGPGAKRLADIRCPKCRGPMERTQSSFVCRDPECNFMIPRAFTPTQVSNYLKSTGQIERGPASSFQSLGARMEHDHDPDVWDEDCPTCNWSTGFGSADDENDDLKSALRGLGEFTTQEAIEIASNLERFQANIVTPRFEPCEECGDTRRIKLESGDLACRTCGRRYDISEISPSDRDKSRHGYAKRGYSDSKLPGGYKNLTDFVVQTLKGSPEFEPIDRDWAKKMWTARPLQIRWRYVGPGATDLREIFGEAITKPAGSKPFQDWTRLGINGQNLKKAADQFGGDVFQTPDGQIQMYKDQMQPGEEPMVANIAHGTWTPMSQFGQQINPNDTTQRNKAMRGALMKGDLMGDTGSQNSQQMENVFFGTR